jgi:predicted glutamine amidotransferase
MCGIVAILSKIASNRFAGDMFDIYGNQISRGQRGFGLTFIRPDLTVKTLRATTEPGLLMRILQEEYHSIKSKGILFHHRQPTSTRNTIKTTHPFVVSHPSLKNDFIIVHNGIINNDQQMRKDHDEQGYTYQSIENQEFNDSEPGAVEFAKAVNDSEYTIQTCGSQAYAGLVLNKKNGKVQSLVFGTNGRNPLKYHWDKERGLLFLASELKGTDAENDKLYIFHANSGKLYSRPLKFTKDSSIGYYGSNWDFDDDSRYLSRYHRGGQIYSGNGTVITPSGSSINGGVTHATAATASSAVATDSHGNKVVPYRKNGNDTHCRVPSDIPATAATDNTGGEKTLCQAYDRQIDMMFDLVREFRDMLEDPIEMERIEPAEYARQLGNLMEQAKEAAALTFALAAAARPDNTTATTTNTDESTQPDNEALPTQPPLALPENTTISRTIPVEDVVEDAVVQYRASRGGV